MLSESQCCIADIEDDIMGPIDAMQQPFPGYSSIHYEDGNPVEAYIKQAQVGDLCTVLHDSYLCHREETLGADSYANQTCPAYELTVMNHLTTNHNYREDHLMMEMEMKIPVPSNVKVQEASANSDIHILLHKCKMDGQ
ncbi:hypothetical protein Tco_0054239 [Tanacetum coccineum]